jgi:hypothetical protein
MTDLEIVKYFENRGFTVLDASTRGLDPDPELCRLSSIEVLRDRLRTTGRDARCSPAPASHPDDLVTLQIQPVEPSDRQPPFTVVFSRSHGRVVGEQD